MELGGVMRYLLRLQRTLGCLALIPLAWAGGTEIRQLQLEPGHQYRLVFPEKVRIGHSANSLLNLRVADEVLLLKMPEDFVGSEQVRVETSSQSQRWLLEIGSTHASQRPPQVIQIGKDAQHRQRDVSQSYVALTRELLQSALTGLRDKTPSLRKRTWSTPPSLSSFSDLLDCNGGNALAISDCLRMKVGVLGAWEHRAISGAKTTLWLISLHSPRDISWDWRWLRGSWAAGVVTSSAHIKAQRSNASHLLVLIQAGEATQDPIAGSGLGASTS